MIGFLPSASANEYAVLNASSLVAIVRTTSTSSMTGTGLKKWRPTTRSGRPVAAAMSVIVREDVLEANMVSGPQRPSRAENNSFFAPISSTIASITRCRSAKIRELGRKTETTPCRIPVGHCEFSLLHCSVE